MTWKPTPEVKALHDQAFGWLKQFSVGNYLVEPRKGTEFVCETDAPVVEFKRRNGRLCAVSESGMWFILGVDR